MHLAELEHNPETTQRHQEADVFMAAHNLEASLHDPELHDQFFDVVEHSYYDAPEADTTEQSRLSISLKLPSGKPAGPFMQAAPNIGTQRLKLNGGENMEDEPDPEKRKNKKTSNIGRTALRKKR